MFWKRSHREERRQKVLDELFVLEPAARRERLDRAVAAREVNADEVDTTLRLVERLDALRVFTVHPGAEAVATAPEAEMAAPGRLLTSVRNSKTATLEVRPPAVAVAEPEVHGTPRHAAARPRRHRVGVPVVPDAEEARRWLARASMPLDALEAASRLVARDKAAQRSRQAAAAPAERELLAVMAEMPSQADLPVSIAIDPEPAADENWPSIAWLRP